mgnify:CR=1 FL=1
MPSTSKWSDKKFGEAYDKNFTKYSANVVAKTNLYPIFKSTLVMPMPYLDTIKHLGSVMLIPGFINGNISNYALDEISRNHSYLVRYKDNYYPSLALKTFLYLNNEPQIVLTKNALKFPDLKYEIKHVKNSFFISITLWFSICLFLFSFRVNSFFF